MATRSAAIEAELRRKARLGIEPTDPRNRERYNQLRAQLNQTNRPSNQVAIRDYLTERGIANDQIGYRDGAVTVGGRYFTSATPAADGRTYATRDDLARAYNNYINTRRQDAILQRNEGIYNELANLRNQLSQPLAQFSYNPETDPQYQAALRQARANAQQAAGDIAADMNRRGLLNSTITADRGNQAAQREYAYVSDTLLPQLMQQAYDRYLNQQALQRQQALDQLGLLQTQYGMVSDEDARLFRDLSYADTRADVAADQRHRERLANWAAYMDIVNQSGNFGLGPQSNWSNLVTNAYRGEQTLPARQWQDTFDRNVFESDRAFERGVLESDRAFNRSVLESDRNYGLQSARERRLASGQELDNLYRLWQATGVAPEGIPGVEPGTPYAQSDQSPRAGTLTANQFVDYVASQYMEPVMDEYGYTQIGSRMTTDPQRREEMFQQVVMAGYDDNTTYQILGALGFTPNEIQRLMNKYGGQ